MSDARLTVAIPVGSGHERFLSECLDSVWEQTRLPDEVLLISDMAELRAGLDHAGPRPVRTWSSPWRLGVGHAFNFGVALAENDLVFLLGADDKLLPRCLEKCLAVWESEGRMDTYYGVGVRYSDGRGDQYVLCNAAMVTKGLWKATGGFPVEAASGAPDAAFLSILLGRNVVRTILVDDKEPLYWYRVHENCDTARRSVWQGVILQTRDILTRDWQPPMWTKLSEVTV